MLTAHDMPMEYILLRHRPATGRIGRTRRYRGSEADRSSTGGSPTCGATGGGDPRRGVDRDGRDLLGTSAVSPPNDVGRVFLTGGAEGGSWDGFSRRWVELKGPRGLTKSPPPQFG